MYSEHIKRALKKARSSFSQDLTAALSVAIVAIPQALAYASLAGLPPHLGLYALTLPVIIAAVFGTSKILSTGPAACNNPL